MVRTTAVLLAAILALPGVAKGQVVSPEAAVLGECIQNSVQPEIERIGREAYEVETWTGMPLKPTLRPGLGPDLWEPENRDAELKKTESLKGEAI